MPELTEPVDTINRRLADVFGVDDLKRPIYRIVWSEDQFENRFGIWEDYDANNVLLRTATEIRYVPKYRQWIHEKHVLENLVAVPDQNSKELGIKVSYEPLFVFMDGSGFPLPPKYEVAWLVIQNLLAIKGKGELVARYKDAYMTEDAQEVREKEIAELKARLFGNESELGDYLSNKQSTIIMPKSIKELN